MSEHESIDVFEAIEGYYAAQEDRVPEIKQAWVQEHMQHLSSRGRGRDALGCVWDDINAFSLFVEDMEYSDLSGLPHWQYSAFVQWAADYIDEPDYTLQLEHVRRLMGNLKGFFELLVDKAHLSNLREISRAYDYICGHGEVRLIELLPYTGAAHWLTAQASFLEGQVKREAVFSVSDKWLILLLSSVGGSWDHLRRLASTVPTRGGGTRKLAIYNLRRKMSRIGYDHRPEDLLMLDAPVSNSELDKATRWFFRG